MRKSDISSKLKQNLRYVEQVFIDFLQGDRSTKIYNLAYYIEAKGENLPSSANEGWDEFLDKKTGYYIYQNETDLISRTAADIAAEIAYNPTLVELGVGSKKSVLHKTLPFLYALKPQSYVANDLSLQSVSDAESIVHHGIPHLKVKKCQADFLDENSAVRDYCGANVLMTGSTISNITAYDGHVPVNEVVAYLRKVGRILGDTGHMIITQDTNRDKKSVMESYSSPAYLKFRLEALYRMKIFLGLDTFDPSLLAYKPVWEKECHLLTTTFVNTKDQHIRIGGKTILVPKGRRLYSSNSYKYPINDFIHMCRLAGLAPVKTYLDAQGRVALHVLKKSEK